MSDEIPVDLIDQPLRVYVEDTSEETGFREIACVSDGVVLQTPAGQTFMIGVDPDTNGLLVCVNESHMLAVGGTGHMDALVLTEVVPAPDRTVN